MLYVNGIPVLSGDIRWQLSKDESDKKEGVILRFHFSSPSRQFQRHEVLESVRQLISRNHIVWVVPGQEEWILDLDRFSDEFKKFLPELSSINWLKGKISIKPEFETDDAMVLGSKLKYARVAFYIVPEAIRRNIMFLEPPSEIKESLRRFREDFPDSRKVGFIIMKFGETRSHVEILNAIRDGLTSRGLAGVRSDHKQYHDDLFFNVMTYMYGCGFGIAVFERIESEEFNPNVSLEVGYMLALGKPVCLIKDRTLKVLQTDLMGKLYKAFNPQDPLKTIVPEISCWLSDKGIV